MNQDTATLPVERLGDYTLIRPLAEGGMGRVYLARQEDLDRHAAIKVLRPEYASDDVFVGRFRREARSAASLDHPNIVQIYHIGHEHGLHYFAMEYVDGVDLRAYQCDHPRIPMAHALDFVIKTADALKCAAERNIVHRDIKPHNIMVWGERRIKVTDFGLAKCLDSQTELTEVGKLLGSVQYMSPEQVRGESSDIRSDIYSLGVVFYQLLAGRPPFEGGSPTTVLYRHVYEPPPPLRFYSSRIPESVETCVSAMLAKAPGARPQTYPELIASLEDLRARFTTASMPIPAAVAAEPDPEPAPADAPTRPDIAEDGVIRVLVVDEDREHAAHIRDALGEEYGVLVADSGPRALELWYEHKPDLVFLDPNLDNMVGTALLEERLYRGLGGRVIVVTAATRRKQIERLAALGISDFLLKPVNPDLLRQRARKALDR